MQAGIRADRAKFAERQSQENFMKDGIPHRNHSPHGWWIASFIMRAAWEDEPNPSLKSRCWAWENTIILQAPDREAAYEKALALAEQDCGSEFEGSKNRKGRWVFEGLTSLLAIHEELQDGAEILWEEHDNRTLGKIRSWIKRKDELEVFDDTPAVGDLSD
ncbi:DUF4288 domain-containing protein [Massilia sp. W12]|uniref:DUF4288 domain-containing protein n=1 Tax=Massilia sp. W12 TaxID=3126507 RepID=UPI0030D37D93